MNLGIAGKHALIMGASSGLGLACAQALAGEGVNVTLIGRNQERLQNACTDITAQSGVRCDTVAADVTTEAGRSAIFSAVATTDILITNNGGPPPGKVEDWDRDAWVGAFDTNMIPQTLFIRHYIPFMRKQRFGRIVNITSAMVKSPRPHMALSSAARTALTAFSKALSLEVAVDNVTINCLLPERIDTPRQRFMAERMMKAESIDLEEARRRIALTIAAKRMGRPEEFGTTCAFLCSVHAGFMSGQNILLDGGSYAGLI